MICVGIDVAKDKYDCFILSSEGEVLADVFTIPNNAEGFDTLLQTMMVPLVCLFDAGSTGRFTLVTLFYINRLAVSN